MDKTFTFTVNGERRSVTTDPARPLLEVLREDLGLTGSKYGCGEGQCGACTVLVGGRPIHACITPVADMDQKTIVTIEGLSPDGKLHPIQEAFLAEGGYQCGYCTPGMIMMVAGLLNEHPKPTEEQVRTQIESHICRCCGYPRILNSVRRAAGLNPQ
jgi:aerobic-type carbon monoxide dehydrogenase small subunit (CoxS/CutS family)